MGFTSHGGDPQWLRDQRDAQKRATKVHRAMPYPSQTPQHQPQVSEPSTAQFVRGAKSNSAVPFVLGLAAGLAVARGRR